MYYNIMLRYTTRIMAEEKSHGDRNFILNLDFCFIDFIIILYFIYTYIYRYNNISIVNTDVTIHNIIATYIFFS